jgi:NAD(P)-dependent dehydrogenase (short-subunit alcohol dehydrogenase family)
VRDLVTACLAQFGRIDILVNNAAVQYEVALHETTYEQWRTMLDVNLGGYFLTCKHAIPAMLRGGGGSIVNMRSVMGLVADPKLAAYCATKGGILAMTRAIAVAYGVRAFGPTLFAQAMSIPH